MIARSCFILLLYLVAGTAMAAEAAEKDNSNFLLFDDQPLEEPLSFPDWFKLSFLDLGEDLQEAATAPTAKDFLMTSARKTSAPTCRSTLMSSARIYTGTSCLQTWRVTNWLKAGLPRVKKPTSPLPLFSMTPMVRRLCV
jgi:hypothetical protein